MEETDVYRIKIVGPGLNLEMDVSPEIGRRMVVLALTGDAGARDEDTSYEGQREEINGDLDKEAEVLGLGNRQLSIREFFNEKKPNRNPDKITAIGVFLKHYKDQSNYRKEDVVQMYTDAAESIPANLTRDIRWAVRAGWIAPQPNAPDTYYVTSIGENVVNDKFPQDAIDKTRQPVSKKSKAKKTQS